MHSLVALLPIVQLDTRIRTLRTADLAEFHAYRSDADLAKYQGWSPMSMESARSFIDEMASVSGLQPGKWIQMAIADSRSNEILGDVGLYLEPDESASEIGFTLCRAAQGRGHATRAVSLSLSLLFAASSVPFVRAVTDARNLSSVRLLERTGFTRSFVQQTVFKGEPCTELLYICRRPDA